MLGKDTTMNLVDAYVTEVIGEPFFRYDKWWVYVRYDSYGRESFRNMMFNTKEEADKLCVGYHFLT